jgi:hypothetical protein
MNISSVYEQFKESGELYELLPTSTGVWEKDKEEFKEIYQEIIKAILDEEEDEDY